MKYAQMLSIAVFTMILIFCLNAFAQQNSLTVTIYNQDLALIHEVRTLQIPRGEQSVEFKDVAETIDPTSLQVRSLTSPDRLRILDQNYEYDLINVKNLLDKYVGKRLRVVLPDPKGAEGAKLVREGTLLANNDKPIFRFDGNAADPAQATAGEVYVGNYDAIMLPELPEGLRPQPTLVWLVDNQGEQGQQIEVSYLAGNIGWKADYVLKLDRNNTAGALSGWVTLDNKSGKYFQDAELKLVAGDVHKVKPEEGPEMALRQMKAAAVADEALTQEEMFEYHLYSLGRRVNIANKQTKQVSLLQSPSVTLEKRLVGRWGGQWYDASRLGVQKEKIAVYLKFKNVRESGLGIPLPRGIVRAYQESGDGTLIFVGEDLMEHTGKGVEVELKMGDSFDVVVERKQTEFKKVGANTVRYKWELRIKNGKDVPQKVELEEMLDGDWKIVEASSKYEKIDAKRIRFTVEALPSSAGEDTIVTYMAEIAS